MYKRQVIKLQNTPNPRYKDKYIVTMTPEERKFSDVASEAFGIQRNLCSSIEQTRERIREKDVYKRQAGNRGIYGGFCSL